MQRIDGRTAGPAPPPLNQRAQHRHQIDCAKHAPAVVAGRPPAQHTPAPAPAQWVLGKEPPGSGPGGRAPHAGKGLKNTTPTTFSKLPLPPSPHTPTGATSLRGRGVRCLY